MRNLNKPALLFALTGISIAFTGILLQVLDIPVGELLIYTGLIFLSFFWLWSLAEIADADHIGKLQKMTWLLIILSVPVLGGLVFHILYHANNKIIT